MIIDVIKKGSGLHVTRLTSPTLAAALANLGDDEEAAPHLADTLPACYDEALDRWHPVEARPSPLHEFDAATRAWVRRQPDAAEVAAQWAEVRARRNALLAASDWTQGRDVPESTSAAWAPYRQALRDITTQTDPFSITWPSPPA